MMTNLGCFFDQKVKSKTSSLLEAVRVNVLSIMLLSDRVHLLKKVQVSQSAAKQAGRGSFGSSQTRAMPLEHRSMHVKCAGVFCL